MALTDSDKTEVVIYLGYTARTIIQGSTDYSNIVNDRLLNLPEYVETRIKKYLRKIRETDEKIDESITRVKISSFENIKFNPNELPTLRSIRRTYVKELAALIGIPYQVTSNGAVTI